MISDFNFLRIYEILCALSIVLVFLAECFSTKAPMHWAKGHLNGDQLDTNDKDILKSRRYQKYGNILYGLGGALGIIGIVGFIMEFA